MVTIKSEREIELMREAGKILAKVHEELGKVVRPGISTKEIDRICEEMIRSYGCIPSFLGYEGYPASVCIRIIYKICFCRFVLYWQFIHLNIKVSLCKFCFKNIN